MLSGVKFYFTFKIIWRTIYVLIRIANMSGITFDTHEAVTELTKAGFKKEQAEALVNFEKSKDITQLSTKSDIFELKIWVLKMMLGQSALIVGLLKLIG